MGGLLLLSLLKLTRITISRNTMGLLIDPSQLIADGKCNLKTGSLDRNFHKPEGETKMYVQFENGPQTNFKHT